MKEIKINYSGQIVILTKEEIKTQLPENCKKILNYFLPLRFDKHNICIEDYKIFSDVDWMGDDDVDAEWVWEIATMYVGHILGVESFYEEGFPFPTVLKTSELTDTQIKELDELFNAL